VVVEWEGTAELTSLGTTAVDISFCTGGQNPDQTFAVLGGAFGLDAGGSAINGNVDSGTIASPAGTPTDPLLPISLHVSITSGTGAFSGASGSASVVGSMHVLGNVFEGTISGTFEVPQ
jgi:hypothetical protein